MQPERFMPQDALRFPQIVRRSLTEKILPFGLALSITSGTATSAAQQEIPPSIPGIEHSLTISHNEPHSVVSEAGRKKKEHKHHRNHGKKHRRQGKDPYEVKAIYAIPSDVTSEGLAENGEIETILEASDDLLFEQTGQRLRFDRAIDGSLDIDTVSLDFTSENLRSTGDNMYKTIDQAVRTNDAIEKENNNDMFVIFTEAGRDGYICGESPRNNSHSTVIYLDTNGCFNASPNPENNMTRKKIVVLHELFHGLGAVPDCAPDSDGLGHVDVDPRDLMYSGDQNQDIKNIQIDLEGKNYAGENVCGTNVLQSVFITENGKSGVLPPGWKKKKH